MSIVKRIVRKGKRVKIVKMKVTYKKGKCVAKKVAKAKRGRRGRR